MPLYTVSEVLNRQVHPLPYGPVVSLVPSLSQTVAELGAENLLTGITKFCTNPAGLKMGRHLLGGTKNIKPEKIKALDPAWILASREENIESQVRPLAQTHTVLLTDIVTLTDALEAILALGIICQKETEAALWKVKIRESFAAIPPLCKRLKAAYFIWKDPWMVAGGDTFIHQMMVEAGFDNVFGHRNRYPVTDLSEIPADTEVLLFSSEPFPFVQQHLDTFSLPSGNPDIRCMLVDGEMFSWYGTQLSRSAAYFSMLKNTLFYV